MIFSLYYAVKHQYIAKIAENLSSTVSCTLHRIKVPEPVTVKSVIEELKLRTIHLLLFIIIFHW